MTRADLLIATALACALGCESTEDKAARLRTEALRADLTLQRRQADFDSVASLRGSGDSLTQIYYDSLRQAQSRHDAVQREWNRFMSGR